MSDLPSAGRTLRTVTLGCRVNQYETEYLRQGFQRLGYRDAVDGEPVDLCLVNTCTVTAESEAKSRKAIRRLAKLHPRAEIIVLGCYVARAADEAAALPGVAEVVADKQDLPDLLLRRGLTDVPTGIDRFDDRRRAYVKVQDGCPMRCSYCIVPLVRRHIASRPVGEVLAEVRRLVEHGHREIVLTGIHLGCYGRGANGAAAPGSLATLVEQISDLPGDFRVRLSSVEASEVAPELIALMAERPDRICPHLHLPLQSGSDSVLKRMNRRWPAQRFIERCREIQASLDRPALTTDVIVGFPGESDTDFEATCRVVEEVGFSKVHVFRFSPRDGTAAAQMPQQVMNRTAQRRASQLNKLGCTLRAQYLESLLGLALRPLIESPVANRAGFMMGVSERHATVVVPGGRELIGQFASAPVERIEGGRLWATPPGLPSAR
ncbi:MAG: tRNA (N(6)-L-threonylcarbamoyladenosine(37)-C(2))-methylthiotransferase MtaB [Thermoguttaceae bacterium]